MIILTLAIIMCAVLIGVLTTLFGGIVLVFGDLIVAVLAITLIVKIIRKIKSKKKS